MLNALNALKGDFEVTSYLQIYIKTVILNAMFGKKSPTTEIIISNKTILRIIGFMFATMLFVRLVENILQPLTYIFVSFFLALALNPAVTWISSKLKSRSRAGATAISYALVITVLITFALLVVPPLVHQTTDFIKDVPSTLSRLENQDSGLGRFVRENRLQTQIQDFANDWARNIANVKGPVFTAANRVIANVISIITVLVLTFMMLVEGPRWLDAFWGLVPAHDRKRGKKLAHKMYKVVTSYVNGQVLVAATGSFFAMVTIVIASTLYGVSINAMALAGIVFLFSLIPTVGAILGAGVVTLFALFESPSLAATLLVYFIIYQQIENATIQPYIQSRGNELTPMLVFVAAILGIGVGGVLGGFVAIPIAGCIKVLIDDWLENRGAPVKTPTDEIKLA